MALARLAAIVVSTVSANVALSEAAFREEAPRGDESCDSVLLVQLGYELDGSRQHTAAETQSVAGATVPGTDGSVLPHEGAVSNSAFRAALQTVEDEDVVVAEDDVASRASARRVTAEHTTGKHGSLGGGGHALKPLDLLGQPVEDPRAPAKHPPRRTQAPLPTMLDKLLNQVSPVSNPDSSANPSRTWYSLFTDGVKAVAKTAFPTWFRGEKTSAGATGPTPNRTALASTPSRPQARAAAMAAHMPSSPVAAEHAEAAPALGAMALFSGSRHVTAAAHSSSANGTAKLSSTGMTFRVHTDGPLMASTVGLTWRLSKHLGDRDKTRTPVPWGSTVVGIDEGDGWVKVGGRYLPTSVRGAQTLSIVGPAPPPGRASVSQAVSLLDKTDRDGLTVADLALLGEAGIDLHSPSRAAPAQAAVAGAGVAAQPDETLAAAENRSVPEARRLVSGSPKTQAWTPVSATPMDVLVEATLQQGGGLGTGVVPSELPRQPATGLTFENWAKDEKTARGVVRIGRAANEVSVDWYNLYWAIGGQKIPGRPVVQVLQKTGADLECTIDTVVPDGVHQLIVLTGNGAGEMSSGPVVGFSTQAGPDWSAIFHGFLRGEG